jgi:hypothetical protein
MLKRNQINELMISGVARLITYWRNKVLYLFYFKTLYSIILIIKTSNIHYTIILRRLNSLKLTVIIM